MFHWKFIVVVYYMNNFIIPRTHAIYLYASLQRQNTLHGDNEWYRKKSLWSQQQQMLSQIYQEPQTSEIGPE